jgi:SAM-dependent methyltransferase
MKLIGKLFNKYLRPANSEPFTIPKPPNITSEEYWSDYNVTAHKQFSSREESIRYFEWRSEQYYDYLTLMPVAGHDGKVVLDYGCGPGHDLVGFTEFSRPTTLIGVDVSGRSLAEAQRRLELHDAAATLIHLRERETAISLPDASVDYIHSSGVLHHTPDPTSILKEFRRIVKPDGVVRVMVYNYDCIWLHLYAAYMVRLGHGQLSHLSVREAFRRSTDTTECPISEAWTVDDVNGMARAAGFHCKHIGNATSVQELAILPERFKAILEPRLESEHRRVLLQLTFDARGVPKIGEHYAGIDACYEMRPA